MEDKSFLSRKILANIAIVLSTTLIVFLITHNNYPSDSLIYSTDPS